MNHWCESCARKNLCYVVDDRPKCFVPITNTASGTPESYLAKALRFSRDSHEIAKTENSSEKPNNCEVKNYCDDCLYTDTCDSKEFFYACTSKATISKMEQVDKPTTQTETQNSNLTFEKDECAKEYEELGLKELKELIEADRKTEPQTERSE